MFLKRYLELLRLVEYCKFKRYEVYKVYKDAGISGAKADRPGLNALLNDAKKGLFSSVGIWTISRIRRNLSHFLMVIEELNKNNITLFSMNRTSFSSY